MAVPSGLRVRATPLGDEVVGVRLRPVVLLEHALEALRCRAENVVTSRADADVGSILGWGFPMYTGGVLSWVGQTGAAEFEAQCNALADKHGPRFAPPDDVAALAA